MSDMEVDSSTAAVCTLIYEFEHVDSFGSVLMFTCKMNSVVLVSPVNLQENG